MSCQIIFKANLFLFYVYIFDLIHHTVLFSICSGDNNILIVSVIEKFLFKDSAFSLYFSFSILELFIPFIFLFFSWQYNQNITKVIL